MDQESVLLAGLAAAGRDGYSPVQIQKLFFLLDKRISMYVGGPKFDFQPYAYGPFDSDVYRELERLEQRGLVEIARSPHSRWNTYRASKTGLERGEQVLESLTPPVSKYIRELSSWIRSLTFSQLVSAIYEQFPEMKTKSVFRG